MMAEFYTISQTKFHNSSEFSLWGENNIDFNNEIEDIFSKNDIKRKLLELYPQGISNHGIQYLCGRFPYRQDSSGVHWLPDMTAVESIFELVRLWKFPDKPSRFTSSYGCETIEEAKLFRENYRGSKGFIFKISTDSYFKADMSLLMTGASVIASYFFAEKYWRGESGENPFWEILIGSPVRIIECVD